MPVNNPFDGFIKIQDAPDLTGKSLDTLRRYCREGKLTRYKFGNDVYLKLAELVPQPQPKPNRVAPAA